MAEDPTVLERMRAATRQSQGAGTYIIEAVTDVLTSRAAAAESEVISTPMKSNKSARQQFQPAEGQLERARALRASGVAPKDMAGRGILHRKPGLVQHVPTAKADSTEGWDSQRRSSYSHVRVLRRCMSKTAAKGG
eukprot:4870492-Prymnesium_polylepis.1